MPRSRQSSQRIYFDPGILAPSLQLGLSSRRSDITGLQAAGGLLEGIPVTIISASPELLRVARLLRRAHRFDVMAPFANYQRTAFPSGKKVYGLESVISCALETPYQRMLKSSAQLQR